VYLKTADIVNKMSDGTQFIVWQLLEFLRYNSTVY